MTKPIAIACKSNGKGACPSLEGRDRRANGNAVAHRVQVLQPQYTLPDFDRTLRGKLMQRIVDYLHRDGD
jgi:hypothetical protein